MKQTILSVMLKVMMVAMLLIGGGVFCDALAEEQIPMQIIKDGASSNSGTYAPPRPWYITQNGYVLTLPGFEDDYILELRDEDDVVVYTDDVPAGTTQIVLPSTLSGDFEIRLVGGTYYYRGYISLCN